MKPEHKFAQRLTTLFGEPKTDDVAGYIAEYVNVLRGQSSATLERAADILIRQRKFRAWPTVAECLDAVAEAKRSARYAAANLEPIADFDGWWAERTARIATAKTEAEIRTQLDMIEPYAIARWIADHRLLDVLALADKRRKDLRAGQARAFSERVMGEAR